MPRDAQLQMRRDTAANWTSTNPTLAAGEYGVETNTGYIKCGDGSTAWTSLPYVHSRFIDAWTMQPSSGWDVSARWALGSRQQANGTAYFTCFVPGRTFTASTITMATTIAATDTGGTTVRRMGLYSVNTSTNVATLQARTASDSTLFTSTTTYAKTFDTTGGYPATYSLTAGSMYAVGVITYNTGGTYGTATLAGINVNVTGGLTPYLVDSVGSQTDLPTTRTLTSSGASSSVWARLT